MSWNVFSKSKSNVPDILLRRIKFLKGLQINVKYLRCDNAGEHQSELRNVTEQYGITIEYTAPNTQNIMVP